MTEYGIRELKYRVKENKLLTFEERKYIIKALEEIQKYRAIGHVEQLKTLQEDYWKLNEISKEYSAIGTAEEFKDLKEKNEPKKPTEFHENEVCLDFICPNCKEAVYWQPYKPKYCKHCGQKLVWS